jgi:hypothetical protein
MRYAVPEVIEEGYVVLFVERMRKVFVRSVDDYGRR